MATKICRHSNSRLILLCWIQLFTLSCVSCDLPELNLTVLSEHAVLGQPFFLQCVLNADGTMGVLIFKHGNIPKCSVARDNCQQYTPEDSDEFACECTSRNGTIVTYGLKILEVKNETVGTWQCEYQKRSNPITVELTDPEGPGNVSLAPPSPVVVMENRPVNLTCSSNCIPACRMSWTRGNTDLSNNTEGHLGQSLVLEEVSPDQDGQYTCTAINPATHASSNASLQLIVQRAPRLDSHYSFSQRVCTRIGDTTNLTVHFIADLAPTFTWGKIVEGTLSPVIKRGREGEERRQQVEQDDPGPHPVSAFLEVTINDENDLGMYQVTAENRVGKRSVYLELVLEEVAGNEVKFSAVRGTAMLPFEAGIGIGAGAMLLIALFVGGFACNRYYRFKKVYYTAHENPYEETNRSSSDFEDHYIKTQENHYQELPTPNMERKLKLVDPREPRALSAVYTVSLADNHNTRRDGCNSVVVGKSMLNPVYKGFNAYEIPVTTKESD